MKVVFRGKNCCQVSHFQKSVSFITKLVFRSKNCFQFKKIYLNLGSNCRLYDRPPHLIHVSGGDVRNFNARVHYYIQESDFIVNLKSSSLQFLKIHRFTGTHPNVTPGQGKHPASTYLNKTKFSLKPRAILTLFHHFFISISFLFYLFYIYFISISSIFYLYFITISSLFHHYFISISSLKYC